MFDDLFKSLFAPILLNQEKQLAEIRSLRNLVARWLLPIPAPFGAIRFSEENDRMKFTAELPPLPSPMPTGLKSIASQNFYVTAGPDGAEIFRASYPVDGSVLVTEAVPVDLNSAYRVWCSYQDDQSPANVSEAVFQDFTAKDDVPPDAPGAFGKISFSD